MGEMNSTKNSTPSPVIKLAASPPMYHPSGKVSSRSPGTAKQFSKNAANSPRLKIHQTSMGL